MKLIHTLAAVAVALAPLVASAEGNDGSDICGALLCMSTLSTSSAPHECKKYVEPYFEVRAYKGGLAGGFDPGRTMKKRREALDEKCPESREIDRERVNAKFGPLEFSPFAF